VPGSEQWSRDHFLKNLPTASGAPIYAHLAAALTSPLYTQVVGRASNVALTNRVPLL